MEKYLQAGVITSTHGLKGEVKVFPTTDDPERFEDLETIYLDTGREKKPLQIQSVRYFKQFVILKFKGFDDINQVEGWKQRPLLVDREHALELGEDENFIADLIGLTVRTEEGEVLGELTDVLETGANDVYVVETPQKKELLLPAIKQCILQVDLEEGVMTVRLLKGLRDL
ncbi:MAG: ribosome maturation factor RimM [Candidatus Limivivens sp.]|nr:ribosome maturation factor RimM [Candidatus Limivivens sp.]